MNEKPTQGGLLDEFRRGLVTRHALDPTDGDPSNRLHLGQIEKLQLVLELVGSLPEGPWKPDWLRLEINGREVLHQEIGTDLKVAIFDQTDEWAANYPI